MIPPPYALGNRARIASLDRITRLISELALDHDERDALVRHLDRVRVPQLMRREPPPHACYGGGMVQLLARG